jgi:hypothetical protein
MAAVTEHDVRESAHSAHKRRVNELIFESLAAYPRDSEIAFFCECPAKQCFETVWMTLAEYERGRSNPRWYVLRVGHRRPAAPLPAARESAPAVPA